MATLVVRWRIRHAMVDQTRLLSPSRGHAPATTDAQIDEINQEIAEFFGQVPAAPLRSPFDPSPQQARIESPRSVIHAQAVESTHAAYDGRSNAADKAGSDATIAQLRERVNFLEKLVEQLVLPMRKER